MGRSLDIDLTSVVNVAVGIAIDDGMGGEVAAGLVDALASLPEAPVVDRGVSGLERLVVLEAARRMSEDLRSSAEGLPAERALVAMAIAYRRFAIRHPGLYRSLVPTPEVGPDAELEEALARPRALVVATLVRMGASEAETPHLVDAYISLLHGFITLEREGGFGDSKEHDRSFDLLIEALMATISEQIAG